MIVMKMKVKMKQTPIALNGIKISKMTLLQINDTEQNIKLPVSINRRCMLRLNYLTFIFFYPMNVQGNFLCPQRARSFKQEDMIGHDVMSFG